MTPLAPDDVTKLVADLMTLLERGIRAGGGGSGVKQRRESLDQGYRWLHGAAYGLSSTEPPTSTVCPKCHGTTVRTDEGHEGERCDECAPGHRGDTTGDAVANRQHAMAAIGVVSHALNETRSQLTRAVRIIQNRMESEYDPIPTPRTEPLAGVKEAIAAQERRIDRSESWGEG